MKLLVITQRVDKDDENLGAFYYWFEAFASRFESVVIIADGVGNFSLPDNVEVYSLGKERRHNRIRRIWKFWEFFSEHYAKSDAVFFHMIPEFVIAAAPFTLSLKGKRVSGLWYAHKSVTPMLRCAEKIVDYIFSSSEAGFRLPSKKILFVGQAINTSLFRPSRTLHNTDALRMVSVGRISPVKNYEAIIRACALLPQRWGKKWSLSFIGGPLRKSDEEYMDFLKRYVSERSLDDRIQFMGPRKYSEIPSILQSHDMFINVSKTGSLDKAVLEAMSCGLTVIAANEAYKEVLPQKYFLDHTSPEFLSERIQMLASEDHPSNILSAIVGEKHSLEHTIDRIVSALSVKP